MIKIEDINDSRIDFYRDLRSIPRVYEEEGIFCAEGEKVVRELFNSSLEIISFFALPEYHEKYSMQLHSRLSDPSRRFTADKQLMSNIVGFKIHTGIMAVARQPQQSNITDLEFPLIAMNGIVNSENVGAIIRNAWAFGFKSLIYDGRTSNPFLRRAVRVSLGKIFYFNHYSSEDLYTDLRNLKEQKGAAVISAEILPDAIDINEFSFPERYVLVFGNEGHGVAREIIEISDYVVYIPIRESVSSINVAATSAIFLHEAQKVMKKV